MCSLSGFSAILFFFLAGRQKTNLDGTAAMMRWGASREREYCITSAKLPPKPTSLFLNKSSSVSQATSRHRADAFTPCGERGGRRRSLAPKSDVSINHRLTLVRDWWVWLRKSLSHSNKLERKPIRFMSLLEYSWILRGEDFNTDSTVGEKCSTNTPIQGWRLYLAAFVQQKTGHQTGGHHSTAGSCS